MHSHDTFMIMTFLNKCGTDQFLDSATFLMLWLKTLTLKTLNLCLLVLLFNLFITYL